MEIKRNGILKDKNNHKLVSSEIRKLLKSKLVRLKDDDLSVLFETAIEIKDFDLASAIMNEKEFYARYYLLNYALDNALNNGADITFVNKVLKKLNYSNLSKQNTLSGLVDRVEKGELSATVIDKILDNNSFYFHHVEEILAKVKQLNDDSIYDKLLKSEEVLTALVSDKNVDTKLLDEALSKKGIKPKSLINMFERAILTLDDFDAVKKIYSYPGFDYDHVDYSHILEVSVMDNNFEAANFIVDNCQGDIKYISDGSIYNIVSNVVCDLLPKLAVRKENGLSEVSYNLDGLLTRCIASNKDEVVLKIFENQDFKYNFKYDYFMTEALKSAIHNEHEELTKKLIENCDFVLSDLDVCVIRSFFHNFIENKELEEMFDKLVENQEKHKKEIFDERTKGLSLDKCSYKFLEERMSTIGREGGEKALIEFISNEQLKHNKYYPNIVRSALKFSFYNNYKQLVIEILTSDDVEFEDLHKILSCVPKDIRYKVMNIRNAKEVERAKKASKQEDGKKQEAEETEAMDAETKTSEEKEESDQEGEKE